MVPWTTSSCCFRHVEETQGLAYAQNSGRAGSRPWSLDHSIKFLWLGISSDCFKPGSWNLIISERKQTIEEALFFYTKAHCLHYQVSEVTLLKPLFADRSIGVAPHIFKNLFLPPQFLKRKYILAQNSPASPGELGCCPQGQGEKHGSGTQEGPGSADTRG